METCLLKLLTLEKGGIDIRSNHKHTLALYVFQQLFVSKARFFIS